MRMKYRIFLATVLFIVAGIVFYIGAQLSKGENFLSRVAKPADVVVDSLSIAGVSQLVSEGICDIEIFNSDREMMVVSYDATHVTNHSKVEGPKLIIHLGVDQIRFFDFTIRPDVKVKIYTQHLDTLINIGTGHIAGRDTMERESLYLLNDGVGSIEYTTKARSVVAKNRGIGSLDIFGFTDELFAINEGIGSINTNKLIALNVKARNSGVGSMELYAGDSLALSNDGIGSIRYSGPGKVYSERNEGVGSIKRD
jgi:hypothetical protein